MKQRQKGRAVLAVLIMVVLALLSISGIVRAVTTAHIVATSGADLPPGMSQPVTSLFPVQGSHVTIFIGSEVEADVSL
jgi:hypothetical protein